MSLTTTIVEDVRGKFAPFSSTRSPKEALRQLKRRQKVDEVLVAYEMALKQGLPMGTEKQAMKSVASLLLPFLFRWFLSQLASAVISFIWNKAFEGNKNEPAGQRPDCTGTCQPDTCCRTGGGPEWDCHSP